jgi:hypothetical protein
VHQETEEDVSMDEEVILEYDDDDLNEEERLL